MHRGGDDDDGDHESTKSIDIHIAGIDRDLERIK
jgi:hypothetical protein